MTLGNPSGVVSAGARITEPLSHLQTIVRLRGCELRGSSCTLANKHTVATLSISTLNLKPLKLATSEVYSRYLV